MQWWPYSLEGTHNFNESQIINALFGRWLYWEWHSSQGWGPGQFRQSFNFTKMIICLWFLWCIITWHEFPQRMRLRRWVKLSQPAWTWVQWSICEEQSCQLCKWTSVASFEKLWQTGSKNIVSGLCCCFTMTIPSSWLRADLNPRWVRVLILATASNEANLDTTEYKCGLDVDDQIWCKCIRIRAGARW